VSGAIGSKYAQTTIYWLNDDIQIICGCSKSNSFDEFRDRVLKKHANDEQYRAEYLNFIEKVEKYIKETK